MIKTVQRHIVREVEKEVFQDRLVVDPAAQRALEWARQDQALGCGSGVPEVVLGRFCVLMLWTLWAHVPPRQELGEGGSFSA